MKAINISSFNAKFAKNQKEYSTLPAHKDKDGIVTTCWELTPEERIEVLKTGRIYLQVMTFNNPLQPQIMQVNNPISDK